MKVVEYITTLGTDGRRRTRHVRIGRNIIEFIVQYEVRLKDEWYLALTFAEKDIRENWMKYRENFLKEIEE